MLGLNDVVVVVEVSSGMEACAIWWWREERARVWKSSMVLAWVLWDVGGDETVGRCKLSRFQQIRITINYRQ